MTSERPRWRRRIAGGVLGLVALTGGCTGDDSHRTAVDARDAPTVLVRARLVDASGAGVAGRSVLVVQELAGPGLVTADDLANGRSDADDAVVAAGIVAAGLRDVRTGESVNFRVVGFGEIGERWTCTFPRVLRGVTAGGTAEWDGPVPSLVLHADGRCDDTGAGPTATTAETVTTTAVRAVSGAASTVRVPEVVVPGTTMTVGVTWPGGPGRRVEVLLVSADGCASIGGASGELGGSGTVSLEVQVPTFLVRNLCGGGPASHRVLSDALDVIVREERAVPELQRVRVRTVAPVIGVPYRTVFTAVPPCGGYPSVSLGDVSWRPRDATAPNAATSRGGVLVAGEMTLRASDSATFVSAAGTVVELRPAQEGEVEVC